jgi:hypothetical protein
MYNTVDDLSTGEVESTLVKTFNGAVDYFGSTRRTPRSQKILFKGTYLAEKGVIGMLDASGSFHAIVDGAGRRILNTAKFFTDLKVRTDTLKGRLGYLARLVRQPEDTVGNPADQLNLQWKMARLLSVKHERTMADTDRAAHIEASFETVMSAWKSINPSYYPQDGPASMTNRSATFTLTTTGSETINDFVLRLWPSNGPLTKVTIKINESTITWDNSAKPASATAPAFPAAPAIAVGAQIYFDMGREIVVVEGREDAYNYFNIDPKIPGWLYLIPGLNTITITAFGADVDYQFEYYNQWT